MCFFLIDVESSSRRPLNSLQFDDLSLKKYIDSIKTVEKLSLLKKLRRMRFQYILGAVIIIHKD